jgi:hypothetical protein
VIEKLGKAVRRQRSNQLNYVPTRQINEVRNRRCLCGSAQIAYRALIAFPCLKERSYRRNRPQTAYKFLSELPHCSERPALTAWKKTKANEPRKNILTASLPAGKGASPFSNEPTILAMYSPLRSHTRFSDSAADRVVASTGRELDRPASLVSQA